jgi:hypothetical protein
MPEAEPICLSLIDSTCIYNPIEFPSRLYLLHALYSSPPHFQSRPTACTSNTGPILPPPALYTHPTHSHLPSPSSPITRHGPPHQLERRPTGPRLGPHCRLSCTSATPLTTTFTPPASCTRQWTPIDIQTTYLAAQSGDGPSIQFARNVTTDACLPSQVAQRYGNFSCGYCASSLGLWVDGGEGRAQGFRCASR